MICEFLCVMLHDRYKGAWEAYPGDGGIWVWHGDSGVLIDPNEQGLIDIDAAVKQCASICPTRPHAEAMLHLIEQGYT